MTTMMPILDADGHVIETNEAVVKAFRPKSAIRPRPS